MYVLATWKQTRTAMHQKKLIAPDLATLVCRTRCFNKRKVGFFTIDDMSVLEALGGDTGLRVASCDLEPLVTADVFFDSMEICL